MNISTDSSKVNRSESKTESKTNGKNLPENVSEGKLTRTIEEQTAKIPSLGYLSLALGSMAVSASLAFLFHKKEWANFVGLWAPSLLIIGLYNKLVKMEHEIVPIGNAQER